jgi:hypothetical protein
MLQNAILRALIGHAPPLIAPLHNLYEGSLYQPVSRHLFPESASHDLQHHRHHHLQTIFNPLFLITSLGRILQKTLFSLIFSRLYIAIRAFLSVPNYLFLLFFPSTCANFFANLPRHVSLFTTPLTQPPLSLSDFSFTFHLASDNFDSLPSALHAHVTRADFDPDFVATLLSRAPDNNIVDIILDTGCTFSITPDHHHFVIYEEGSFGQVQAVNGLTSMAGYGLVRWTLLSEDGTHLHLLVPCHHILTSKVRLLSPQDYCQYQGYDRSKDQFGGNSNYFWMHANQNQSRFQCAISPRSNLPVALTKTPCNPGRVRSISSSTSLLFLSPSRVHQSLRPR